MNNGELLGIGTPDEEYLRAYGAASQAARNGELVFTSDSDSRAVGWAAMHAYHEVGYAQPGRAVVAEASTDTEEFLSVYHAARLRIAEGETDITLPVTQAYERPDLRRAVIEACREASAPLLAMNVMQEQTFFRRLLRSFIR